jgi:outer membrane immunogenic protein
MEGNMGNLTSLHLHTRVQQLRICTMTARSIGALKKLLLAGVGIVALLSEPVGAADLARPAPVYASPPPPIVAVFTWTGCYVGGNVGGIWANDDWQDTVLGDFGSSTSSGVLGGAQIGCNYQVGTWVFGIQGDYDWTNANSNTPNAVVPTVIGGPVVGLTDSTTHNALASVTGRVGYSWDRLLGYVKAGGAWLNSNYAFLVNGLNVASDSATQTGWTVGVGAEYAFLNWLTGFVEYDYYVFNSATPSGLVCAAGAACGFVTNSIGIMSNVNVVKAGFNFKFGPGSF